MSASLATNGDIWLGFARLNVPESDQDVPGVGSLRLGGLPKNAALSAFQAPGVFKPVRKSAPAPSATSVQPTPTAGAAGTAVAGSGITPSATAASALSPSQAAPTNASPSGADATGGLRKSVLFYLVIAGSGLALLLLLGGAFLFLRSRGR